MFLIIVGAIIAAYLLYRRSRYGAGASERDRLELSERIYTSWNRHTRRWILTSTIVLAEVLGLGSEWAKLFYLDRAAMYVGLISAPVAQVSIPIGADTEMLNLPKTTPKPEATPTPVVPKLNPGSIWMDKPNGIDGSPNPMGNVSGKEYWVVGVYGCWPLNPVEYAVRLHIDGEPNDWWVLRASLPDTDAELKPIIESVSVSSQYKPGVSCNAQPTPTVGG